MTRIAKLDARFRSSGRLDFEEFRRLLKAYGFELRRIRGSHHVYEHATVHDQMNIQPLGKEAKPYQVRQFLRIVAQNELALEGDA